MGIVNKVHGMANKGAFGTRIKGISNNRLLMKGLNFADSQLGSGFKGTMYNRGKRRGQKGGLLGLATLALAAPMLAKVISK